MECGGGSMENVSASARDLTVSIVPATGAKAKTQMCVHASVTAASTPVQPSASAFCFNVVIMAGAMSTAWIFGLAPADKSDSISSVMKPGMHALATTTEFEVRGGASFSPSLEISFLKLLTLL